MTGLVDRDGLATAALASVKVAATDTGAACRPRTARCGVDLLPCAARAAVRRGVAACRVCSLLACCFADGLLCRFSLHAARRAVCLTSASHSSAPKNDDGERVGAQALRPHLGQLGDAPPQICAGSRVTGRPGQAQKECCAGMARARCVGAITAASLVRKPAAHRAQQACLVSLTAL